MKHRHLSSLIALTLCLGVAGANAQYFHSLPEGAGPYCRFELGPAFTQNGRLNDFGGPVDARAEYSVGFAALVAFGYAFNKYVATDFEFGAIGSSIDSVSGYGLNDTYLNNLPFVVNLTLSYPIPRTRLVPYVGAGAGGTLTIFSTDGFGDGTVAVFGDDSEVVFAWQAFAGMRLELNPQMTLSIGYRYFTTQDNSFSYPPGFPGSAPNWTVGFDGVQAHSVLFGFQVRF